MSAFHKKDTRFSNEPFKEPPRRLVTARQTLHELEALSERLPFESITTDLTKGGFEVSELLNANYQDRGDYTMAKEWTELGIRHQWAELQLIYMLRGFDDMRPSVMKLSKAKAGGAA